MILLPAFNYTTPISIMNPEIKNKFERLYFIIFVSSIHSERSHSADVVLLLTILVLCSFPLSFGFNFKNTQRNIFEAGIALSV
jgi:hypothetical protein